MVILPTMRQPDGSDQVLHHNTSRSRAFALGYCYPSGASAHAITGNCIYDERSFPKVLSHCDVSL